MMKWTKLGVGLPLLVLCGCEVLTFPIYAPNRQWYDYEYYWWYYDDYYWDYDYDTGDDCDPSETSITSIDAVCSETSWTYGVDTAGWTSDGDVTVVETGVEPMYTEAHALPSVDYDPSGCWDQLRTDLLIVEANDQQDDVSSAFECTTERQAGMTWMIRVWDPDSNLADCRVWGHDVSYFSEYGCAVWGG